MLIIYAVSLPLYHVYTRVSSRAKINTFYTRATRIIIIIIIIIPWYFSLQRSFDLLDACRSIWGVSRQLPQRAAPEP